jgi:nitrite reductase/ring-hydroxylating ferredoxin subunit
MPDPSDLFTSIAATRRTVLRVAGLAALSGGGVAVLGACSPDAETSPPATSPPVSSRPATSAPATSATASSSPPTEAAPTPSATARRTAPAPSGPSVATSKVPVGGGVILKDADYVITQPKPGKFKAFSKICTHRQCPVTSVTGGTINCPCHGSKYSIEDGSVVNPPAPAPLKKAKVTVSGGRVVVNE